MIKGSERTGHGYGGNDPQHPHTTSNVPGPEDPPPPYDPGSSDGPSPPTDAVPGYGFGPPQGSPPQYGWEDHPNTPPPPYPTQGPMVTSPGYVPFLGRQNPEGFTMPEIECWDRDPIEKECPYCHANITTVTKYKIGSMVWIVVVALILAGLWVLMLCFIPCCMNSLKDVQHSCPRCKNVLGIWRRLDQ